MSDDRKRMAPEEAATDGFPMRVDLQKRALARASELRNGSAGLEERDPEAEAHPLDEVTFPSDEPPGAASETPAWEAGRSPSRSSNPDNDQEATVKDCKIDGCTNDASDAPKRGLYVGLCGQHRKEKGAAMAAARRGGTGGATRPEQKRSRTADPPLQTANGSYASRAERLLAAARAVDEAEQALAQAKADLSATAQEFV